MVMKNLIAELLLKLAQKEEESKELVAQVEALEIIVTAMLRNMAQSEQQKLISQVEGALEDVKPDASVPDNDTELLRQYVKKLLKHPRH
ncbi:anti-adapter protein IraP [Salmonella bongori]|nr:anti-adapter protein IraP [Salmonella bongori serovar 48:i:-]ECG9251060.1 anti-adapter protein IraP [Salmonella bongori]EGE4654502.1 anti-adapter protein IraP [Salmonella bongori serovar 40:z35:- str. 95-0123]EGE4659349.1 anti-adapter protein IraP [Salmonella bongori serovar 48:i:- str. 94-0708]QGF78346.1 anti-adapter protein IraP [Salmonella bongori CFSAN000510]